MVGVTHAGGIQFLYVPENTIYNFVHRTGFVTPSMLVFMLVWSDG